MRQTAFLWLFLSVLLLAAEPAAAPQYFKYVRDVKLQSAEGQAYFSLDQVMWEHMREDLGDMRIYASGAEVPYALKVQRGGRSVEQSQAKLFDLGEHGGAVEFKLEAPVPEYDSVGLDLKTHNFVTLATVEGSEDGVAWKKMATGTIFDFTDERLGSNFEIKLPSAAKFRQLRVRIADKVPAKDVQGASMAMLQERGATWITLPGQPKITQAGKETVVEWDSPEMPLERVELAIGDAKLNFARPATLQDADGRVIASGELTRVHLKRGGRDIDREELGLELIGRQPLKHYKLTIENGDDRPLPIERVLPLSYERRVYFDAQGKTGLKVYFDDEKLEPPVYDFARFFQEDPKAQMVSLEPSASNLAFQGRPDERPWSERNKWVMWVVLVAAVLGLGAVAVRGLVKV